MVHREDPSSTIVIPDELIFSKIFLIRDKQVILDKDLADFYQVETKQLKRAVRRNIDRFPDDFMFELTDTEFKIGGHNLRLPIKILWD